jgi:ribosome maturation protein Sdo1
MEKLGKIDVNLDKILSIDEIFKDSKAGDEAKEFTK